MRWTVLLFIVVCATPAWGQGLLITATEPASGAASVPLETTMAFTFSAPLDTTVRFSQDGTLPVEFFAISPPDSIRIDSTYFSDDLTQLFFDVEHTAGTDFVWILTGAYDQAGGVLCQPHVLSYTTAAERGPFTVSGLIYVAVTVKRNGADCPPDGLFAALWNALPEAGGHIVAAAVAEQSEGYGVGHFGIEGVREGTYWLGPYLSSTGITRPTESHFFYDADFDGMPDPLVVADSNRTELELIVAGPGATSRRAEVPGIAALLPGYPNPFNPQTRLAFRLERPAHVVLAVYDVLGRRVATVAEGFMLPGRHEAVWNASGVPSGLYLVRLEGEGFVLARTVVLAK